MTGRLFKLYGKQTVTWYSIKGRKLTPSVRSRRIRSNTRDGLIDEIERGVTTDQRRQVSYTGKLYTVGDGGRVLAVEPYTYTGPIRGKSRKGEIS